MSASRPDCASISPFKEPSKAPRVLSCFFCHDQVVMAKEAAFLVSHAGSPAAIERCRFDVSSTQRERTREGKVVRDELLRTKEKKLSLRLFFPRRRAPCAPETARQAPFSTTARPQAPLFVRDYRASEEKEINSFWSFPTLHHAHHARSGDFRG